MRQALAGLAPKTFFRTVLSTIPTLLVASAIGIGAAQAAAKPKSFAAGKYAAIVVDANTGKTLFQVNADNERFPASLTKMMTLYMVFEAMEAGRITKETRVPFSAQAASRPPTKIGVRAGGSVSVEAAILSLVTKSANDAAAALGELLGGSEARFAGMMTQKARRLGMSSTVFQNASGLPNPNQHTTARDMATLGLALRAHFPQYYDYFSTRSFTLGKQRMANHNRLLGRVKGVDGIKTGYVNASGFNLVSSVVDGNRRVVAVVMGGSSGRARDDHMADLLAEFMPKASTRGGPLVASATKSPLKALAEAVLPRHDAPTPQLRDDVEMVVAEAETVAAEPAPKSTTKTARITREQAYATPEPATRAARAAAAVIDPIETASVPSSGWAVQVASSPSKSEAQAFLDSTSAKAGNILASASPFTVAFKKDGVTYYRARFGGFASKTAAWDACGALKKRKVSCYAVEQ
ncbi:MAG: D-alanyl-D-alanine carboxypeptidase [Mesorhizobium amorphae]|nr:MAG: D-alanyl-D-alanine carboxypeptidase [Mesorhizobium amorphae]